MFKTGQKVLDLRKHPHKKSGIVSQVDHRGFLWVLFPDISTQPIDRNFGEVKLVETSEELSQWKDDYWFWE